jgi:hypothetical protein
VSKDFVNLLERLANNGVELVEVEDTKMRVLNLDALIKTKRAMNRPHDRETISQLEAIKKLRKG